MNAYVTAFNRYVNGTPEQRAELAARHEDLLNAVNPSNRDITDIVLTRAEQKLNALDSQVKAGQPISPTAERESEMLRDMHNDLLFQSGIRMPYRTELREFLDASVLVEAVTGARPHVVEAEPGVSVNVAPTYSSTLPDGTAYNVRVNAEGELEGVTREELLRNTELLKALLRNTTEEQRTALREAMVPEEGENAGIFAAAFDVAAGQVAAETRAPATPPPAPPLPTTERPDWANSAPAPTSMTVGPGMGITFGAQAAPATTTIWSYGVTAGSAASPADGHVKTGATVANDTIDLRTLDRDTIVQIQQTLGIEPADGVAGPATIRAFNDALGLERDAAPVIDADRLQAFSTLADAMYAGDHSILGTTTVSLGEGSPDGTTRGGITQRDNRDILKDALTTEPSTPAPTIVRGDLIERVPARLPAGIPIDSLDRDTALAMQTFLNMQGIKGEDGQPLDRLEVNGIVDQQTRYAFNQFCEQNGLNPNDGITQETIRLIATSRAVGMDAAEMKASVIATENGTLTRAELERIETIDTALDRLESQGVNTDALRAEFAQVREAMRGQNNDEAVNDELGQLVAVAGLNAAAIRDAAGMAR
jgi:hypothetical protein